MKTYIFIALAAIFAVTNGVFVPPRPGHIKHKLGLKECANGPTYWCQNITTAAHCNAVTHCIQTVWIFKQLPPDGSSVCQTCLDMVKQARDQLLSNETQEEIKEVFEGSCALLKIKPIVKECDQLADQFIPQLVDTLASEMNPQVVCSVAGLCNNERVHQLLREAGETIDNGGVTTDMPVQMSDDKCVNCKTVTNIMVDNFNSMSRDEVLHRFLTACGYLSTFSDSCSTLVLTYFNDMYSYLKTNLNADDLCLLSGSCYAQFHKHANVEITPMSKIGYVPVGGKVDDDLPCELCEQLVTHLRDILIANTTEDEFKQVIEGLCKQTGSFAKECVSLAEQYYSEVYNFLVTRLNSTVVCDEIGICKDGKLKIRPIIAPFVPVETAVKIYASSTLKPQQTELLQPVDVQHQLPIELLVPPHNSIYNQQVCVFCEYLLHYVQTFITNPTTEDEVKTIIDKACSKLPSSVNVTCRQFIDTYEPAMVALLAQEIDPSQVCPLIRACPSDEVKDVDVFMQKSVGDSKCPMCLLAVTEVEQKLKDNKTKADVKTALDKLCSHFPKSLQDECLDFINTYTDEIVDALLADLKPQEVCVYLKLCTDTKPATKLELETENMIGGDIETNVIPDNTINGAPVVDHTAVSADAECTICEFVMKEIDDELKDKTTDDEIKKIVKGICNHMPGTVKTQCNSFVDEYADAVIALLQAALEPADVCTVMHMCKNSSWTVIQQAKDEIVECAICEWTITAMERILSNPKIDHDIEHVLEKTCRGLPAQYRDKCNAIIDKYGAKIFDLIMDHAAKQLICHEILLCKNKNSEQPELLGEDVCTYGPSYWCESEQNADQCGARPHCESKVWGRRIIKRQVQKVGTEKCTYGPAYWCASRENAAQCGKGATSHCESKVWNNRVTRQVQAVGSEKCTYGPAYWCASKENARECGSGALQHCEEKVWKKRISKRQVQKVGTEKCTYGPAYWCESRENAAKCGSGATQHCESKVWNKRISKRQVKKVGTEKCTYGPAYWCASRENAAKCGAGATSHCESKVWNKSQ